jgi:hypothetical protein
MVIIGAPSTSIMFLLRVRAVYANRTTVTVFFGLLCLAIFATLFLAPFYLVTVYLGPELGCGISQVKYRAVIPILLRSAFDTLVFFAISFRIASYSVVGDTFSGRMRCLLRGEGLPKLSRCIVQGGQSYYLFVNFYLALYVPHDFMFQCNIWPWPCCIHTCSCITQSCLPSHVYIPPCCTRQCDRLSSISGLEARTL